MEHPESMSRDVAHETHLVETAALAVGMARVDYEGTTHLTAPASALNHMALQRALPGGVTLGKRDLVDEVMEELADSRNYLVWHIQRHISGAIVGNPEAAFEYERGMRALASILQAAEALSTPSPE